MARLPLVCVVVVHLTGTTLAAEPKPLWEIELGVPENQQGFVVPGWLGISPDGKSLAAVVVDERTRLDLSAAYTLHVWETATRKERFRTKLDIRDFYTTTVSLAAFAPENTIITAGGKLVIRSLADGKELASRQLTAVGSPDIWVIADLKECFHIHRPPHGDLGPVELLVRPVPAPDAAGNPGLNPEVVGRVTLASAADPDTHPRPVALSPDGKYLATGYRDGSLVIPPTSSHFGSTR